MKYLKNYTYGFGNIVLLKLSFHCKSVTRLPWGTLGRQVNIKDLPTGFLCTSCMGNISNLASLAAKDKSGNKKKIKEIINKKTNK